MFIIMFLYFMICRSGTEVVIKVIYSNYVCIMYVNYYTTGEYYFQNKGRSNHYAGLHISECYLIRIVYVLQSVNVFITLMLKQFTLHKKQMF